MVLIPLPPLLSQCRWLPRAPRTFQQGMRGGEWELGRRAGSIPLSFLPWTIYSALTLVGPIVLGAGSRECPCRISQLCFNASAGTCWNLTPLMRFMTGRYLSHPGFLFFPSPLPPFQGVLFLLPPLSSSHFNLSCPPFSRSPPRYPCCPPCTAGMSA